MAPKAPTPVPDAEALRRAALQASWRRDRRVARRRVWLRWWLWVTGRFLLPALLAFGLGAWLWLGVLPSLGYPQDHLPTVEPPAAIPAPASRPAPPVQAPLPPLPSESAMPLFSPEGEELPVPLALRFESHWTATTNNGTPAPTAPDTVPPTPPHLKPENWLHSKEP